MKIGEHRLDPKKLIGFTLSIAISATFLALTAFYSLHGEILQVFVSAFFSWNSYLLSHYSVTGKIVDGGDNTESTVPKRKLELPGLVLGTSLVALGIIVGGRAIAAENLLQTVFAAFIFWTGYITAHFSTTRELV
ncbi:hypothetical protein GLU60_04165 [Nanohaloarchaea archaeon H01]|nr:hypothetical protein [Nanohaloarchaea archaeon H01]